jgi:putative transposase
LPTTNTWARSGVRPLVPHQAPCGRRVHLLGALLTGPSPHLVAESRTRAIDQTTFLYFVWRQLAGLPTPPEALPAGWRRARPLVIVLDNAATHRSKAVQAVLPALEAAGVTLYYLPPYSPHLNRIEPVWRVLKHTRIQQRSYATTEDLQAAVDRAVHDYTDQLERTAVASTTSLRQVA